MRVIQLAEGVEQAAEAAVTVLRAGGVVVMPMDTSYGLAADATNGAAVEKVYHIKDRAAKEPLSVIVADRDAARAVADVSPDAEKLWRAFMPGLLTIVLPLAEGIDMPVASDDGNIGLRQPDHELTAACARAFGGPYTATSANMSGQSAAHSLEEFVLQLGDGAAPDLAIDGGTVPDSPSSTVVSVRAGLEIVREGAIPRADIEAVIAID